MDDEDHDDRSEGSYVDEAPDLTIEPTPIETARKRHGAAGAMLAAGMLGLDYAMGLKPEKEEVPILVSSPTEPVDIDSDGLVIPVDDQMSVYAPPQPRSPSTPIRR